MPPSYMIFPETWSFRENGGTIQNMRTYVLLNPAAGHSVGTPSPNPPEGSSSYTREAATLVVH